MEGYDISIEDSTHNLSHQSDRTNDLAKAPHGQFSELFHSHSA